MQHIRNLKNRRHPSPRNTAMNVSFTRDELHVLWGEICMLVDAADECVDEGRPRADDATLRRLKEKIGNAYFAPKSKHKKSPTVDELVKEVESLSEWRKRQFARIDAAMGWKK